LPRGPVLSTPFFAPTCPLSLSVPRSPPVSPSPTSHPRPSPWTRPRPRVLRPPPHVLASFEPRAPLAYFPPLTCALSQTLSPPLSLCARNQEAPPPLTEDRHPFCDRRRSRAPSLASLSSASPSATRDALRFAFSLPGLSGARSPERFLRSRSSGACRRRPEALPHPRRSSSAPEFALEVSNLPMPLFRQVSPPCPRTSSPELIRAVVSPPHRVLHPLVLSRRRGTHGRVCHVALNALELFPKPLEPRHGRPPRLRRDRAAPPHPRPTASRWISGVRPRSGSLDLTREDLISALRSRSDRYPLSPSPAPLPLGSAGQPRPGSLTPHPRLSVASARSRPHAHLRDLILSVDLRSDG
jgi:hypothetical protein